VIAYGPLLTDDGTTWLGTAALVRAWDVNAARTVLTAHQYADIESCCTDEFGSVRWSTRRDPEREEIAGGNP
jgi:hypothetical protein